MPVPDGEDLTQAEKVALDLLDQHVDGETGEIDDGVDRSALLEFMQTCMAINPDVMLDASKELRLLVLAVQMLEEPGTVAIELKVESVSPDQLSVVATVKSKLPKAKRGTVLYYEEDGHLTAEDPKQGELPL